MTRPDMSIKVERQLHDMRILGRIVGVRSTEQFVWHLLTPTSIYFIIKKHQSRQIAGTDAFFIQRAFLSLCHYSYLLIRFCRSVLEDTTYRNDRIIVCWRGILNTGCCCSSVYNCVISNIDCNMSTVADDVTWLHIRYAYLVSTASHCA